MSNVSGVSNSSSTATTQQTKKNDEMGKDEFLQLLVTQLQYQDPLAPVDDKEFIAQMAQFSSLEQMQNVSSTMNVVEANSMLGKEVTWLDSSNKQVSGVVTAVLVNKGEPKLLIGDTTIELDKVISVKEDEQSTEGA